MWQAYLNVIRDRAPNALNVLDRFHIVKNVQKARLSGFSREFRRGARYSEARGG